MSIAKTNETNIFAPPKTREDYISWRDINCRRLSRDVIGNYRGIHRIISEYYISGDDDNPMSGRQFLEIEYYNGKDYEGTSIFCDLPGNSWETACDILTGKN